MMDTKPGLFRSYTGLALFAGIGAAVAYLTIKILEVVL